MAGARDLGVSLLSLEWYIPRPVNHAAWEALLDSHLPVPSMQRVWEDLKDELCCLWEP
jgi:hypothetical protein